MVKQLQKAKSQDDIRFQNVHSHCVIELIIFASLMSYGPSLSPGAGIIGKDYPLSQKMDHLIAHLKSKEDNQTWVVIVLMMMLLILQNLLIVLNYIILIGTTNKKISKPDEGLPYLSNKKNINS